VTPAAISAAITERRTGLVIRWEDGTSSELASVWLRDNLPEYRDRYSGQRLIDIIDVPIEPLLRSVALSDGQLRIAWQEESRESSFALAWLYRHCVAQRLVAGSGCPRHWLDGSQRDARRDFAWQSLAALQTDDARRLAWLERLARDGLAFLSEVPRVESGILEAMRLVGHVAETNYGLVFDVRAVPRPENLAYSDVGLGLHTDNPYREPVPGYQALHTLLSAPDGGDSVFADGFALAEYLRSSEPEAFDTLAHTPVPFHYVSAQADLYAERPLIALDCSGGVRAVHYNSRSIAPLVLAADDCRRFYGAYRRFAELLRQPGFQLRMRLQDGELVLFDNQRILHGRTGFASSRYARHLRGCYLTRDSVQSQTALLRRQAATAAAAAEQSA